MNDIGLGSREGAGIVEAVGEEVSSRLSMGTASERDY